MKQKISSLLIRLNVDSFFRFVNRRRLLILMYHGVALDNNCPPLYNQIPGSAFEAQIKFLAKNYNILTLNEFISSSIRKQFPQRAVLITFDDGYANNYQVAFPILKKFNVPATLFLPVDYVGTQKLLWFDELFLLLNNALDKKVRIEEVVDYFSITNSPSNICELYSTLSNKIKRIHLTSGMNLIDRFKERFNLDISKLKEKAYCRLLSWEQVLEMRASRLIDFGVHTATHRILSQLDRDEWYKEIIAPKVKLSKILNSNISSFCYPNGKPDIDFSPQHENYLKNNGYECAFCTGNWLNIEGENMFRIGRLPSGNDITKEMNYFKLHTSGFFLDTKKLFSV